MVNNADTVTNLPERNAERLQKAEQYSVNRGAFGRVRARFHAKLGNDADTAVTALGSKTLAAFTGGFWGMAKGVVIGALIAVPMAWGAPFMAASYGAAFAMYMGVIMLVKAVKGAYDGYYNAEANYAGKQAKKIGDKIAAEGNAQMKQPKQKVMAKAAEMANKEIPQLSAAERQSMEPDSIEDTTYRDMIDHQRKAPKSPAPSAQR